MIGELLGDMDRQYIELMYAYADSLDFCGLDFVEALRCVVHYNFFTFSCFYFLSASELKVQPYHTI